MQFLIVEDHVDRLLQQRHIATGLPAAATPPAGGVTGGVEVEDVEDQEDGGEGDHRSKVSELHDNKGGKEDGVDGVWSAGHSPLGVHYVTVNHPHYLICV